MAYYHSELGNRSRVKREYYKGKEAGKGDRERKELLFMNEKSKCRIIE